MKRRIELTMSDGTTIYISPAFIAAIHQGLAKSDPGSLVHLSDSKRWGVSSIGTGNRNKPAAGRVRCRTRSGVRVAANRDGWPSQPAPTARPQEPDGQPDE